MTQSDIKLPTVLLTGSTSGIGARVLGALSDHPSRPRLVLMARDAAALDRDLAATRAHGLDATGFRVDLGDLASVRAALDRLATASRAGDVAPIDVAFLNAGAQFATGRRTSAQGHEVTFAVNVVAQHLLLRGLEPMLAPGAHTVVMGSSTHRGAKASFNLVPDPRWREPAAMATAVAAASGDRPKSADERHDGGVAYATSKLALVTLAHEWARRLATSGRRLNTYDPGLVPGTGLGKDLPPYMYWVWKHVMPAMSVLPGATTPGTTARHAVELAMGDAFPSLNDGHIEIGRLTSAEQATFSDDRRAALWAWLEAAVTDHLPEPAREEGST